jgi:hypothetical protein
LLVSVLLENAPGVIDHQRFRQGRHVARVMGDEDHRNSEARLHLEKFLAQLGVQPGRKEPGFTWGRFGFELGNSRG